MDARADAATSRTERYPPVMELHGAAAAHAEIADLLLAAHPHHDAAAQPPLVSQAAFKVAPARSEKLALHTNSS